MRHNVAIATGLAAGVTALALAATPALAQSGSWSGARSTTDTTTTCPMLDGTRAATGAGYGTGRAGSQAPGMGGYGIQGGAGGPGSGAVAAPSGVLTSEQKTTLAAMAEEEKLARDLYTVLAERFPNDTQFSRIVRAESRHLAAVRALLTRYGVSDPTAGLPAGSFASSATTALYTSLLASATNDATALAAGVAVEKADIAALKSAAAGVTAPDVQNVYTNLLTASQRHLTAFGG